MFDGSNPGMTANIYLSLYVLKGVVVSSANSHRAVYCVVKCLDAFITIQNDGQYMQ